MKEGKLRVAMERVYPNTWNPNVMPDHLYKKLKVGIKKLLEESGKIPPIVARPNGPQKGYEIIDGEHRWKALDELGEDKISVVSIRMSDKMARIMTNNLTYLRGSPDAEAYSKGLVEMIEHGATVTELDQLLPHSSEELEMLIEQADMSVEAFSMLTDDEEDGEEPVEEEDGEDINIEDATWVDLKFKVSVSQAKVIEKEISRVGSILSGKNRRGRALEYIAVSSSQTELPEDVI